jgi:hypothetical protein
LFSLMIGLLSLLLRGYLRRLDQPQRLNGLHPQQTKSKQVLIN